MGDHDADERRDVGVAFFLRPHGRGLLRAALLAGLIGAGAAVSLSAIAPSARAGDGATADSAGPPDGDGDGVADADDRCRERAGMPPDGCPPRDRDGDRVLDARDACPDRAGPVANAGCPDADRDGDGVVDRSDRCPDASGIPELAGCAAPDGDDDGIDDRVDRCPNEPEVWNGRRDTDGCPDRGEALIEIAADEVGRVIRLAPERLFRGDESLSSRGRDAVRVAAAALGAIRARGVAIAVSAPLGLSYGQAMDRARRRAHAVRAALLDAADLAPDEVTAAPSPPSDAPGVALHLR